MSRKISEETIRKIEAALEKGERVEVIPMKDGKYRIVSIRRKNID